MENHRQRERLPQKKILITDDTPIYTNFLAKILAGEGHQVYQSFDGQTALDLCQAVLPNLILLDIKMPNIDGYQVCQQLKANPRTRPIPVIFISALDQICNKVKGFQVGGVDYIIKPFERAEVICRVQTHLHLQSLRTELAHNNQSLRQEIQERQTIQSALETSEANNRALLNTIPDLMLRISDRGTILDYRVPDTAARQQPSPDKPTEITNATIFPTHNPSQLSSLLVGKQVSEVFSGDLTIWITYYVEQTLQNAQIQIGEYMQQVEGQWQAYEVRYVKSGATEVLALVRDISKRKQSEAERLKTQAMLKSQTRQLEKALSELQATQVQLIQSEKMAAIGQLVSGVAHEINNPINFIFGNLSHTQQYLHDLGRIVQTYQTQYPDPTPGIQTLIEDLDLDFILEDAPQLVNSMHKGAERIRRIILSLRNFSRLDEAEIKAINLHEGIDSTLEILQHRLHETEQQTAIQVIKDYGNLPRLTCYASQINQVLMHLINNAIDALRQKTAPNFIPTLTIVTESNAQETVKVKVIDNGIGISEIHQSQLFNPFFTTKPVGSGTGLGLSISYQIIVQKHNGKLTCHSVLGEGTEFTIEIPVTVEPI